MSWNVPQWVSLCNLWSVGETPADDVPFETDLECQLYLPARGILDITPGEPLLWVPPIWFRLPLSARTSWEAYSIVECPAGSGEYYRARFKQVAHLGFPNEYLSSVVDQCDENGVSIVRYVDSIIPPPPPPPPPPPGGNTTCATAESLGLSDPSGTFLTFSTPVAAGETRWYDLNTVVGSPHTFVTFNSTASGVNLTIYPTCGGSVESGPSSTVNFTYANKKMKVENTTGSNSTGVSAYYM